VRACVRAWCIVLPVVNCVYSLRVKGDDETITCVAKDNTTAIQRGYNEGLVNERHRIVSLASEETTI